MHHRPTPALHAVLLLAATTCGPAPLPSDWATAGCDWVHDTCELDPSTDLVVWLEGTGAHGVEHGSDAVDFRATSVEGGVRLTVPAPVEPGPWTFELAGAQVTLDVRRVPPLERPSCEQIDAMLAAGDTPDDGEGWARAASCARARGETAAMTAHLERAIDAHQAAGEHSRQARRTAAWAHARLEAGDLNGVGVRLRALDDVDANARWIRAHYQARLDELSNQNRLAETGHRKALRWATRLGLDACRRNSIHALAFAAYEQGEIDRARRLLAPMVVPGSCSGVERWAARNLLTIELREAIDAADVEAIQAIGRGFEALAADHCPEPPAERADLAIDIATVHSVLGDHAEALEHTAAAERTVEGGRRGLRPYTRAWASLIRARATNRPDAFGEAIDAARTARNREVELRALTERAVALDRQGMDAESAFQEAQRASAAIAASLPWERQRGAWLSSMGDLTAARVEHLLRARRVEEAFETVREAQSLALASTRRAELPIEDGDTGARATDLYWILRDEQSELRVALETSPADEVPILQAALERLERQLAVVLEHEQRGIDAEAALPALHLGPSEVALASWPYQGERFLFLVSEQGVETTRLPRHPTAADWTRWLEPRLDPDDTVRVLGLGPDERQVIEPFLAAVGYRPLRWSLDLPSRDVEPGRGRLVVGDPTGDLPGARDEARRVASSGDTLLLGPAATVTQVRDLLQTAATAHFAVHGLHEPDAPAASHLVLADGVLRVSDILALDRVPARVFLSGCETGDRRYALGLAQAFVAAGAQEVIASDRVVPDGEARVLVDAWTRLEGTPSPLRLAAARRALRENLDQADWTAWRIWTP